jgi:hypothetical protein
MSGEFRYWPVELGVNGTVVSGWVWDGGLTPNAWTGRMSWMQNVVEQGQEFRDGVVDTWDFLTGWIPGYVPAGERFAVW